MRTLCTCVLLHSIITFITDLLLIYFIVCVSCVHCVYRCNSRAELVRRVAARARGAVQAAFSLARADSVRAIITKQKKWLKH